MPERREFKARSVMPETREFKARSAMPERREFKARSAMPETREFKARSVMPETAGNSRQGRRCRSAGNSRQGRRCRSAGNSRQGRRCRRRREFKARSVMPERREFKARSVMPERREFKARSVMPERREFKARSVMPERREFKARSAMPERREFKARSDLRGRKVRKAQRVMLEHRVNQIPEMLCCAFRRRLLSEAKASLSGLEPIRGIMQISRLLFHLLGQCPGLLLKASQGNTPREATAQLYRDVSDACPDVNTVGDGTGGDIPSATCTIPASAAPDAVCIATLSAEDDCRNLVVPLDSLSVHFSTSGGSIEGASACVTIEALSDP